jgi:hypothetical protein
MHWIFLVIIACLVFLSSYNPRTGNVVKFFAPTVSVDGPKRPSRNSQRKAQSDSDSDEHD